MSDVLAILVRESALFRRGCVCGYVLHLVLAALTAVGCGV